MNASIRVWLPRVIASLVAAASGSIGAWLGREISPSDQDLIVSIIVAIVLLVYSGVHKFLGARINPKDVASPSQLPK